MLALTIDAIETTLTETTTGTTRGAVTTNVKNTRNMLASGTDQAITGTELFELSLQKLAMTQNLLSKPF